MDPRDLVNDGFDFSMSDGKNFIAVSRQGCTKITETQAFYEGLKEDIGSIPLMPGEADVLRDKHGI